MILINLQDKSPEELRILIKKYYDEKRYKLNSEEIKKRTREYHNKTKEKQSIRSREYRKNNREVLLEKKRAHWAANRDILVIKLRELYHRKREERLEKNRIYRENHRIELAEKSRIYTKEHLEEVLKRSKEYARSHSKQMLSYRQKRRAKKANAPICDFTAEQWQIMKEHYKYTCIYCDKEFQRLTQDHITPISKGGNHTFSNIVPACRKCNSRKGAGIAPVPVQPMLLMPTIRN